jgi:hypothetical protein
MKGLKIHAKLGSDVNIKNNRIHLNSFLPKYALAKDRI